MLSAEDLVSDYGVAMLREEFVKACIVNSDGNVTVCRVPQLASIFGIRNEWLALEDLFLDFMCE